MTVVVIDTNVILVANGQHESVSPQCVSECAQRLLSIKDHGRLVLDDAYRILLEYQKKTRPKGGKGPGDAFVKWALQVNSDPKRCDQVPIAVNASREFDSFPDDERLAMFDVDDRKFVAVSVAHPGRPPILQATDSKWLDWAPALFDAGVTIDLVCPDDIKHFRSKKSGL